MQATPQPVTETSKFDNPLVRFGLVVALLAAIRILFAFVTVPVQIAWILDIGSSVVFVGLPIVALFLGAAKAWDVKSALLTVLLGVALQVGCGYLAKGVSQGTGPALLQALGQTGLLIWCLGAGATVACLIKEKNLIIPVALFLAGFDAFLVLTPTAPTATIVENHPEVFQAVASQVPRARPITPTAPAGAKVESLAYIGPADFLFTAVFFALIFRFNLRARETVLWLVPVMIAYLVLVLAPVGLGMLPALVPIGMTVLLVNRKEFQMTGQEKQATVGVAVLALGLAAFGLYQRINKQRVRPSAPSPSVSAPRPAKPASSP